mgnify:FL=1
MWNFHFFDVFSQKIYSHHSILFGLFLIFEYPARHYGNAHNMICFCRLSCVVSGTVALSHNPLYCNTRRLRLLWNQNQEIPIISLFHFITIFSTQVSASERALIPWKPVIYSISADDIYQVTQCTDITISKSSLRLNPDLLLTLRQDRSNNKMNCGLNVLYIPNILHQICKQFVRRSIKMRTIW